MTTGRKTILPALTVCAVLCGLFGASLAQAAPVKLVLSSYFGHEVNRATKENVCVVGGECQAATASGEAGGFEFPEVVVGAANGNVYIADQANHRVQELTATGKFVLMFGKEVNATTHGNICTAEEVEKGAKCKRGLPGTEAEAISQPQDVAVDSSDEVIYVLDFANNRVDEYTLNGRFILMFGREVNETTKGNVCTAEETKLGTKCKSGLQGTPESTEEAAFYFSERNGDLMAVGSGASPLLYVASGRRILEFDSEGKSKGEVRLPASVVQSEPNGVITALTVDVKTATIYVVYAERPVVYELDSLGNVLTSFPVAAKEAGASVTVRAMTADENAHLALFAFEERAGVLGRRQFGDLDSTGSGEEITQISVPAETSLGALGGAGFNGNDELYIPVNHEIWHYVPEPVAELITGNATCATGASVESSVTFDCTLHGQVDPEGVPNTKAWFDWSRQVPTGVCVGAETAKQTVSEPREVSAVVEDLRPDESFCSKLAATDEHVELPELLFGRTTTFETPTVPPVPVGEVGAEFVNASSAVLVGQLNPENAPTEYFFEYGPGESLEKCSQGLVAGESCEGVAATTARSSQVYGKIGATIEASGLQPSTEYRYRLAARNEGGASLPGEPGRFVTPSSPDVTAKTGGVGAITTSSASVTGDVNPDGKQAIYSFEIGVYAGEATQYTVAFSASTGDSTSPEAESANLTGLEPDTVYAYRIEIHSGYGTAVGAGQTFKTLALPTSIVVPSPPSLLPMPAGMQFPSQKAHCRRGYKIDKHQKCVRAKRKARKRRRHRRGHKKK